MKRAPVLLQLFDACGPTALSKKKKETTPFLTDIPQAAASPLHLNKNYPTEITDVTAVDRLNSSLYSLGRLCSPTDLKNESVSL